jgi:hypothetical protein
MDICSQSLGLPSLSSFGYSLSLVIYLLISNEQYVTDKHFLDDF